MYFYNLFSSSRNYFSCYLSIWSFRYVLTVPASCSRNIASSVAAWRIFFSYFGRYCFACIAWFSSRNLWVSLWFFTLWVLTPVILIIVMSCRQHGYRWPSLATPTYRPSPLAGLQGYITYSHIAAVCRIELVVLLLLGHMRGSIEIHHLWGRPCFSSSVLHVWFV